MRFINLFLGTTFLSLGFVGLFVPLLPSTIFFILSAFFYARSSKKLYNYVVNHPKISKHIRIWQEKRAMPKKAKIIAISSVLISIALTVILNSSIYVRLASIILGISLIVILLKIRTY
ncbi:MAG: YbaN family protein [candidate division WOR-3 bacterium]|nr:YbaN family protein [candidate division WOR-3 bacterium]MCX7947875.1 YbaN family protein [candidate division WOR-3 bacterium]MDW8150697.1 YbaN family protein [candidate division WOR-3 bacterium]